MVCLSEKSSYFCTPLHVCCNNDSVAQLVEHYTFNVGVLGSSPSGITTKASKKFEAFFMS